MMRWTAKLKAAIVEDARSGVDPALVLAAWGVSPAEFAEWQRQFDEHGKKALRTTKLQSYREATRRPRKETAK